MRRSDGADALGVYDDVDDDVYAARLERWLKVPPWHEHGRILAQPHLWTLERPCTEVLQVHVSSLASFTGCRNALCESCRYV